MILPNEITDLVSFLETHGFTLCRKEGPDPHFFGNMLIEYGNGTVKVRMELDRSYWNIGLADMTQPDGWYSVGLLRDLVLGGGSDELSITDQVGIVKSIWQEVMSAFSPSRRGDTCARLDQLRYEFDKRVLPAWPDAALELESFLSKRGLVCQRREAPEGTYGDRLMQYADAVIGVRITCGGPLSSGGKGATGADSAQLGATNWVLRPGGWRVEVADSTRLDAWYDVSLVHRLIERTDDLTTSFSDLLDLANRKWAKIRRVFLSACRFVGALQTTNFWLAVFASRGNVGQADDGEMPYLRRFQFVKENWGLIRHLFCDSRRETTHARLRQLMMEGSVA